MKQHISGLVLMALCIVGIYGCEPKVGVAISNTTLQPLPADAEVAIINYHEYASDSGIYIGTLKINFIPSPMTSAAEYNTVIEQAKAEARKVGGNLIKITHLLVPSDISHTTGYRSFRVRAKIFHCAHPDIVEHNAALYSDSISQSKFPLHPQYALLHVFRPFGGTGMLISYNIHADKIKLCRMENGDHYDIKLYKEGMTEIWGRTESRASNMIDVQFGKEYFIICGIQMGVLVGEPVMIPITCNEGYDAYKALNITFDNVMPIDTTK